ncbi:MAG TPA: biotin/lipoyl-binding protein, partial [Burkholderiales bacterium]
MSVQVTDAEASGERRRRRSAATAVLTCMLLLGSCSKVESWGYQGYVEGEYARVASSFAGSLERLAVHRGARVQRGDPLFALESENETAARREAEQRLRTAQAQLANLQKGRRPSEIEAVRAQLGQAQAALKLSQAQLRRTEELIQKNFVSRERLDEARGAYERDRARVAQLEAELATTHLGGRVDEVKAAQGAVAAARASLEQADWR